MDDQLSKIRFLRQIIDKRGLNCELEVDGGINSETAKRAVDAGVDVLVAGSYIFSAPDRSAIIKELKKQGDGSSAL